MKRRDFYFLGLLVCIVVYAASHRNFTNKVAEREGKANTEVNAKTDSIQDKTVKVTKAAI